MSVTQEQPFAETESEPRAVIVADRDGVIQEWNPVAERIFGYSAAQAIGQKIDLVMPEEERADHWRNYRRVIATNIMNYSPDHILDIEGVRKDGSGRIVAITAAMREIGIAAS